MDTSKSTQGIENNSVLLDAGNVVDDAVGGHTTETIYQDRDLVREMEEELWPEGIVH